MSRNSLRKKKSGVPISFFSFLDILGGTIGVLILMIAVFLTQIKASKQIVQMEAETSSEQVRSVSYIICNGSGNVEIHDRGSTLQVGVADTRLTRLINSIKSDSSNRYLIIGVRPNGFADFERVRDMAESAGIDIGYEPLDEGWRIRIPGGKLL